jgi:hypothetical protein
LVHIHNFENNNLTKEKLMSKPETMMIDDVKYIREDSITNTTPVVDTDGLVYSMVRTYSAGVFAGYIKHRDGKEGTLINARRMWGWVGAASLSQLATDGTSRPNECKFPAPVAEVFLTEIIEIIPITVKAKTSLDSVKEWSV